jgi:hypothetical protein
VRENIDQAGVRTGREDEQALDRQVDGYEPLIHQELIGGPLAGSVQSVPAGHALFEGRHPRDLAADEGGARQDRLLVTGDDEISPVRRQDTLAGNVLHGHEMAILAFTAREANMSGCM